MGQLNILEKGTNGRLSATCSLFSLTKICRVGGGVCSVGVLDYVKTSVAHSDASVSRYSKRRTLHVSTCKSYVRSVSTSNISPNVK